jgi:hypothetical protein
MEDTNYTKPSDAPKIGSTQSLLWDIGKEPSPDGSCPLNWSYGFSAWKVISFSYQFIRL